jgi:ABC-type bacteriocin/lantibiotic exporter with double-glycine peptidase domain
MHVASRRGPGRLASVACLAGVLAGCAYTGTATDFDPAILRTESGWLAVPDVPLVRQETREDCGAAALAMVLAYWKEPASLDEIRSECAPVPERGIKAGDLRQFARKKGLHAFLFHGQTQDLVHELEQRRPILIGLVKPYVTGSFTHYEVVAGLHPERRIVVTLDPARGWRQNSIEGFLAEWEPAGRPTFVMFRSSAAASLDGPATPP